MQHCEEDDAREGEALADGLQQLRGQELVRAPLRRQGARDHQARQAHEDEADRGHQPRVRPAQHQGRQRAEDQLRRGDPHQGLADLQRPEPTHRAEVLRDQIGGGQDGQAQEGDEQQKPRHGLGEDHLQIEEGCGGAPLVDHEGDDQKDSCQEQRPHQPRIQPVQAVALVEGGVDQREADPAGGQAVDVDVRPDGRGGIRPDAEVEEQRHGQG